MKLVRSPIISLFTITWTFVSFTSYPSQVWAQFYRPFNNSFMQRSQIEKQKSPDFSKHGRPRPGSRMGTGSRGPCLSTNPTNPRLTALMPITNWGQTVAERPTFWFYVPYSFQQVSSGKFVLYEGKERNYLYEISFTLPRTPGLVSFTIPSTKAPLEVGKEYVWLFKLDCEEVVEGWVERVKPTSKLEGDLKAATEPEYKVYTNHLIWYDALDNLTKLRISQPTNTKLTDEWTELLSLKGVKDDNLDPKNNLEPEKLKQPIAGSVVVLE